MKSIILGILVLFLPVAEFSGNVVGVSDGDTIKVLVDNNEVRIRLDGIDCPEKTQDFGQKAKEFTSNLCYRKLVKVIDKGKDRYGRTLGVVILPDGRNLNELLVAEGYAWHYKKYSDDEKLAALEDNAKRNKKGLWSQSSPTPPWDYRHTKTEAVAN